MFSTDALSVKSSDGRNFVLLEPFSYLTSAGVTINVPAGATSDGASTPPELWPTIPPFGKYWMAAFLHDYLYRCTDLPKAECDSIFKDAMLSLRVGFIEAITIFEGVNFLGTSSFDQDRQLE